METNLGFKHWNHKKQTGGWWPGVKRQLGSPRLRNLVRCWRVGYGAVFCGARAGTGTSKKPWRGGGKSPKSVCNPKGKCGEAVGYHGEGWMWEEKKWGQRQWDRCARRIQRILAPTEKLLGRSQAKSLGSGVKAHGRDRKAEVPCRKGLWNLWGRGGGGGGGFAN